MTPIDSHVAQAQERIPALLTGTMRLEQIVGAHHATHPHGIPDEAVIQALVNLVNTGIVEAFPQDGGVCYRLNC